MSAARLAALAAVVALSVAALGARRDSQGPAAPDDAAFLARAREGTARFRDAEEARQAGYRRVGVDFPAMGEHWVSLERVMADTLDAARPAILAYVRRGDSLVLAGVGYTRLLARGEPMPGFRSGDWHEHNGSVVEESLVPVGTNAAPSGDGPRVAILHAWAWLPNPAGDFVTDNWALPFARLGLTPPASPSPATRGLAALAGGSIDYWLLRVRGAAPLATAEDSAVARRLRRAGARAAAVLRGARDSVDRARRGRLEAEWELLWREVAAAAPSRAAAARALREDGDLHAHH